MNREIAALRMETTRFPVLQQAGGVAAVILALMAQQLVHREPSNLVGWGLFVGAVVLLVAVAAFPEPLTPPAVPPPRSIGASRVLWAGATLLALAVTTVLSTRNDRPVLPLVLWVGTFVCGYLATRRWVVTPPSRAPVPWPRREVVALGAIVVLGGLARGLWVSQLPRYIFADEPRVAIFLQNIYRERIPNFFTMGWNTWSMIGLSLQGIFGPWLGINTTALRLSSVCMGTLAVLTTYLLSRELFTPRLALVSAVLFAICRTAIDFSRLGTTHAQVLTLETLAFFCWWRAINTGKAASYWWAGVALGLCLYTYNAGQLVPLLWLSFVGLCAILAPRTLRSHGIGTLITLAAFAATFFPYLFYATDHFTFGNNWGEFTVMARNRQTLGAALDAWRAHGGGAAAAVLGRQIWLTWLGFGVLPAGAYGVGYRGGGMLDDISASLFILGLGIALVRCRQPRYGFLAYWWLLTSVFGGILTVDAPATVRLVGVLPALAILAALPIDGLLGVFGRSRPTAVAGWVLVGALLLGAGWDNWRTYFVMFPRGPIDPVWQLARTVETLPANATVLLAGSEEYLNFNFEIFLTDFPDKHLRDVADPAHLLPLHQSIAPPLFLILGPTQLTLAGYVRDLYPHTEVTEVANEFSKQPVFRILRLTAEDIAARTGLQRTVLDANGTAVSTLVLDPFTAALALPEAGRRMRWEGEVYWPTDRPMAFTVSADSPVGVRVSDGPLLQPSAARPAEAPLTLPRGWQSIAVDAEGSGPGALAMSFRDHHGTRALTRWDLTPTSTPQGLLATYERDGRPVLRAIDPQLNVFAQEFLYRHPEDANDLMMQMPFVASWQGVLRITSPGRYEFEAVGNGAYSVRLDDQVLFDVAGAKSQDTEDPQPVHTARTLSAGLHPVVAHWNCIKPHEYSSRRLFQLYWTPPGGRRELIPPPSFAPPAQPASTP